MLALQNRFALRSAPNVAALRFKLNRDTEKILEFLKFENVKIRPGCFPDCAWLSHYSPAPAKPGSWAKEKARRIPRTFSIPELPADRYR